MEATTLTEAATGEDIRPFTIDVPEEQLDDLRRRINATKWPDQETDASQGVQLETIQALAGYWADGLRLAQRSRSASRRFRTSSPRSTGSTSTSSTSAPQHEDALPLVVTHGWPGSTIEQLKIIDPLTKPTAHGGERVRRLPPRHPVVARLRVLRASRPRPAGIPIRIARAWVELMSRLGYTEFVAQGGDWGNAVTEQMALLKPPGLLGIHTNMPATVPPTSRGRSRSAGPTPAGLVRRRADARTSRWTTSSRPASATPTRWPTGRRRSTASRTRRSGWRPGCSTTTSRSYELIARAFAGQAAAASRATTSSTTSRTTG